MWLCDICLITKSLYHVLRSLFANCYSAIHLLGCVFIKTSSLLFSSLVVLFMYADTEAKRRRGRKRPGAGRESTRTNALPANDRVQCSSTERRQDSGNIIVATESARGRQTCLKKCRVDADCKGPSRKCLCDADCGLSCIRPSRSISVFHGSGASIIGGGDDARCVIEILGGKCNKFGQVIFRKIIKIVATRCHVLRLKCTKFDFEPQTPLGELTALPRPPSWI